jgi:uncharacterized membrane protein YhaH (DUF805 family)
MESSLLVDNNNKPGYAEVSVPAISLKQATVVNEVKKSYFGRFFSDPIGRLTYFVGIAICSGIVWLLAQIPKSLIGNNLIFFSQMTGMLLMILYEAALSMRRLRDLHMFRWLFFLTFIPGINAIFIGILLFKPGVKKESIDVSKRNILDILKEMLAVNSKKPEPIENIPAVSTVEQ